MPQWEAQVHLPGPAGPQHPASWSKAGRICPTSGWVTPAGPLGLGHNGWRPESGPRQTSCYVPPPTVGGVPQTSLEMAVGCLSPWHPLMASLVPRSLPGTARVPWTLTGSSHPALLQIRKQRAWPLPPARPPCRSEAASTQSLVPRLPARCQGKDDPQPPRKEGTWLLDSILRNSATKYQRQQIMRPKK